jgi:FKBP-type peptidyl-prolyl cis-trans isomerase 2
MHSSGSAYTIPVIMIALAVIIGSAFTGYVVFIDKPQEPATAKTVIVEKNDTVSVNYAGMFQDGTVFDTSDVYVANDDINYPKALSFSKRETYEALNFTVGARQMILGFDDGVLGMHVNETRTLTIPQEKGYGATDSTKVYSFPIFEEAPMYYSGMSVSGFKTNYSAQPQLGLIVKDIYWGWNATVFFIDQESQRVTLRFQPSIGQVVSPHKSWNSKVISIDESANGGMGEIVVQNLLKPSDANKVKSTDPSGQEFRVIGVDPDAETYTVDYNREVSGKTLIFKVTIKSITKAAVSVKP